MTTWRVLNGRTYDECPPRIRKGLDRRRLSATVLLVENRESSTEGFDVRRTVFERLNTGGQNLNAQELRNCLYSGRFNDLIIQLSGEAPFTKVWEIPSHEDNIRSGQIGGELRENRMFRRMADCEIVLRFFAFRRPSHLKGSVRSILDNCMSRYQDLSESRIEALGKRYLTRLDLATSIFEDRTFRMPEDGGSQRLSVPLYDATMVALDGLYDNRSSLIRNRKKIYRQLCQMFDEDDCYDLIVGRPNTARAIRGRQILMKELLNEHI